MVNFLNETRKMMNGYGYAPDDIDYIGTADGYYAIDWNHFVSIADFDYDNGYGTNKIILDIVIRFKDGGIAYRHEYDGSECWEFIPPVSKNAPMKSFDNVRVRRWEYYLKDLND